MTVENYQKVRVSPSGPVIASHGGFSSGRTWMWQGIPTSSATPDIQVPNPTSDYVQGLGTLGQLGSPLKVDIKAYAGSGLVYDIEVDVPLIIAGTNTGMTIWVVGTNDDFATTPPDVLAYNVLPVASAPAGLILTEATRMHLTNIGFGQNYNQVAVKLGFGSSPGTALIYTPADVAFTIREYGTD
jgi:hypothetical protein